MLGQRRLNARDQVAPIGFVVGMLQLAAAAFREMAAWRQLVLRPGRERSVIEQCVARHSKSHVAAAPSDAIATRRDPDDEFVHSAARA